MICVRPCFFPVKYAIISAVIFFSCDQTTMVCFYTFRAFFMENELYHYKITFVLLRVYTTKNVSYCVVKNHFFSIMFQFKYSKKLVVSRSMLSHIMFSVNTFHERLKLKSDCKRLNCIFLSIFVRKGY